MSDHNLDITGDVCPMTWVKARLALEDLEPGDILQIKMNQGESLYNVRTNATTEGHTIIEESLSDEQKVAHLIIEKKAG